MASDINAQPESLKPESGLPTSQVYAFAAFALLIGLTLGYFWIGAKAVPPAPAPAAGRAAAPAGMTGMLPGGHPKPTIEQMKAMAGVKAAPLLEALKKKPKDANLLAQVAALYASTHQFTEAAAYYEKALAADPKNVTMRTDLASNLYYSGDADGALRELQQALKYKPDDVNALFNLGMIRYRGKDDAAGAIAAWQQLLKAHPDLDRKPVVEKMITEAQRQKSTPKN
jgi:cytochrome c-type biogenesis protein CcmH/NrfG